MIRRAPIPAVILAALMLCPVVSPGSDKPASLFAQTAQSTLNREFPSDSISYLLLDARSGGVLAERWANPDEPIPIGSLIKPFTALAYARTHRQFPAVVCNGQRDSCWLPHGHGRITISDAIAQSCNAYFLALAREVSVDQANAVLASYSLPPVNTANKSLALVGLSNGWQVPPLTLARAYATFARASRDRDPEIFSGMRNSASAGTAHAVSLALPGRSALAKTGTARCTHTPSGAADGFTIVLYPADDPRIVLLTRVHGVTGATTAAVAAQMLRILEAGQQ
jgi:cell division protein FtsI/penicillin-binding protein 2